MKNKIFFFTILMGTLFSLASCVSNDPDGLWDPMKWKSNVEVQKDKNIGKYINVPAEGGTYLFYCKNYSDFWISNIVVNSMDVFNHMDDFKTCKGDWGSVESKSNILTVIISPKSREENDTIEVAVTAGDIFDDFLFIQKKVIRNRE